MATLADIKSALVPILQTVTGITTVLPNPPNTAWTDAQLPAVFLGVLPASVSLKTTRTRLYHWPIQIWISVGQRSNDIEDDFAIIEPLAMRVIDRLDVAGTMGGLLARTIQYDEAAIANPNSGTAFGMTVVGDRGYIETAVQAIFTIERTGGFGPNG